MQTVLGVQIAFRDWNGNSWVRKSNGILEKIEKKPTEYYGYIRF